MNNNLLIWIVLGAAAWYAFKDDLPDLRSLIPSGGGVSVGEDFPDKPTDPKVLSAVEGFRTSIAAADSADKLMLARLFREQARLIGMDTALVKNTADVRRANNLSGHLLKMGFSTKYPAAFQAANAAVMAVLTDNPKALDTTTRQDAVNVFNGLSWAARN